MFKQACLVSTTCKRQNFQHKVRLPRVSSSGHTLLLPWVKRPQTKEKPGSEWPPMSSSLTWKLCPRGSYWRETQEPACAPHTFLWIRKLSFKHLTGGWCLQRAHYRSTHFLEGYSPWLEVPSVVSSDLLLLFGEVRSLSVSLQGADFEFRTQHSLAVWRESAYDSHIVFSRTLKEYEGRGEVGRWEGG